MLLKALRNGLGMLLMFANWLTLPKPLQRSAEQQQEVEQQAQELALYQISGCPFCIKVRRHLHRINVPVITVDAGAGTDARDELVRLGGSRTVPCLRIETAQGVQWMYESSDIINYLDRRFVAGETAA